MLTDGLHFKSAIEFWHKDGNELRGALGMLALFMIMIDELGNVPAHRVLESTFVFLDADCERSQPLAVGAKAPYRRTG